MFLTTNRLSEFDSAFESRIQLKVHFEEFNAKQRANIWRSLLEPLTKKTGSETTPGGAVETEWTPETLLELGEKYDVNGRQIKNMITTALAVAEDRGEKLSLAHLFTVAELNWAWVEKMRVAVSTSSK